VLRVIAHDGRALYCIILGRRKDHLQVGVDSLPYYVIASRDSFRSDPKLYPIDNKAFRS